MVLSHNGLAEDKDGNLTTLSGRNMFLKQPAEVENIAQAREIQVSWGGGIRLDGGVDESGLFLQTNIPGMIVTWGPPNSQDYFRFYQECDGEDIPVRADFLTQEPIYDSNARPKARWNFQVKDDLEVNDGEPGALVEIWYQLEGRELPETKRFYVVNEPPEIWRNHDSEPEMGLVEGPENLVDNPQNSISAICSDFDARYQGFLQMRAQGYKTDLNLAGFTFQDIARYNALAPEPEPPTAQFRANPNRGPAPL
jgi:hypothetical protein